jgi:hypothetical protein
MINIFVCACGLLDVQICQFLVSSAGLYLGPIMMIVFCFFCYQSLVILHEMVQIYKVHSFIELARLGLGKFGFFWASLCMFLFNWGT